MYFLQEVLDKSVNISYSFVVYLLRMGKLLYIMDSNKGG